MPSQYPKPGKITYWGAEVGLATPVQLAAGTRIYLQVQWAASWQFGCPEAG